MPQNIKVEKDGKTRYFSAKKPVSVKCKWTLDEIGIYNTDCENSFQLSNDESLKDNEFVYCVYCGRKIKEINNV